MSHESIAAHALIEGLKVGPEVRAVLEQFRMDHLAPTIPGAVREVCSRLASLRVERTELQQKLVDSFAVSALPLAMQFVRLDMGPEAAAADIERWADRSSTLAWRFALSMWQYRRAPGE